MNQLVRTTALVTSSCLSEDDELDLTELEISLQEHKAILLENFTNLRKTADELREGISSFMVEMEDRLPYEHSLLEQLTKELKEYQEKARQSLTQEQEDALFEEFLKNDFARESLGKTREHNEAMSKRTSDSKNKSKGTKRLFRKIAAISHPDKSNDEWKHSLFRMARQAFDIDDYVKLEKIYKCLIMRTTWKALLLEEEIQELQVKEQATILEIQNIVQCDTFKVMQDYRSKIPSLAIKASYYYQNTMVHQITEIVRSIQTFDPDKKMPDIQILGYVEPTTTIFSNLTSFSTTRIFRNF